MANAMYKRIVFETVEELVDAMVNTDYDRTDEEVTKIPHTVCIEYDNGKLGFSGEGSEFFDCGLIDWLDLVEEAFYRAGIRLVLYDEDKKETA